jgi:hypothetical protein
MSGAVGDSEMEPSSAHGAPPITVTAGLTDLTAEYNHKSASFAKVLEAEEYAGSKRYKRHAG